MTSIINNGNVYSASEHGSDVYGSDVKPNSKLSDRDVNFRIAAVAYFIFMSAGVALIAVGLITFNPAVLTVGLLLFSAGVLMPLGLL